MQDEIICAAEMKIDPIDPPVLRSELEAVIAILEDKIACAEQSAYDLAQAIEALATKGDNATLQDVLRGLQRQRL